MIIRTFFIPGIAHCSYLLGGVSSCFIIDPSRDIGQYLTAAKEEKLKITGILQTHLHADFISGHCDLAHETGAPIYIPERANSVFPHKSVIEGTQIRFDDLLIEVWETPGHTPEHVSYVVTHLSRGDKPVAVFCGDTLFVGDVGRPDLFPGQAQELASALYSSLHEKLFTLPDYCEVYPAHGAGSLCGRQILAKRTSTIGYEREFNTAAGITNKDTFIRHLTTDMPSAPDHFSRCSEINRGGPKLLANLKTPQPLTPHQVSTLISEGNYDVVDIRRYDAFGGMHIPSSWNVDAEVNFSTFAGWILCPERSQILVAHNPEQAMYAALMLRRVGIDTIAGFLSGGMQDYALSGQAIEHCKIYSPGKIAQEKKSNPAFHILDVRTTAEFAASHIQGSIHIPWADLRGRNHELDKSWSLALVCGTGVRAGIACSILQKAGFSDVSIVAGGYTAMIAAGF